MPRRLLLLLALIVPLLPAAPARAWSRTGHQAIATLAYLRLPLDARDRLLEALRAHPFFPRWEAAYRAQPPSDTVAFSFGQFVVAQASLFPDEIRRTNDSTLTRFDHPNWHFVDFEIQRDGTKGDASPLPEDDLLFGLRSSMATAAAPGTPAVDRAVALSWILHLVGDQHQPLHSTALVSPPYSPPMGDRGGNDFWVRRDTTPVRLHSLWDELLGRDNNPWRAYRMARVMQILMPPARLPELGLTEPRAWSLASRDVSFAVTYDGGRLAGGQTAATAAPLPAGYLDRARTAAMRQAALAGYRLARVLTTLPGLG